MQDNQRGGIVSFIIVGIVLAGLLAGALYFSKQQGRQARNATPAPQISKQSNTAANNAKKDNKTNEPAPKTDTSNNTKPAAPQAASPQQPAANPESPAATDRVATTGPSDDLPSTGPAETTAIIVALGGLTFASYAFVTAQRGRRSSALRK